MLVSLEQVFCNNTYHGEEDPFSNNITFRADCFLLPLRRIFITLDDFSIDVEGDTIHLNSERKVIVPQGMREYYSDEKDAKAYYQLRELIEIDVFWNAKNTTEKLFSDGAV